MTLPANSARSILLLSTNHSISYQLDNTTGVPQSNAFYLSRVYVTLESAALNDPALLNPFSNPPNQPFNGKIDVTLNTRRIGKSMAVNERFQETLQVTRVGGLGRPFFAAFNLPPKVIDAIFKGQITIHLNLAGSARLVDFASAVGSIRVLGN